MQPGVLTGTLAAGTMNRMTSTQSLELVLALEKTDDGYCAQVRQSPAGQGETPFVNPFSARELTLFWTTLEELSRGGRPSPDLAAHVRATGQRLFEAVFRGEVLGCLRASFDLAQVDRLPLRIHLDLSTAPEFESLPWVYLYNPERGEYMALARSAPPARYTPFQHRILPLKAPTPLRTLVMTSGPSSYPRVNVDQEWLSLLDTVDFLGVTGQMVFERLQKPTLLDLQRRLRQTEFHVLHYVGHAQFDKITGAGQLVFEDEMGRSRLVDGQHLGSLLRDHYGLRLVILSGPTRTQVDTEYHAFMSVARSLVQRGMAAVIAPQFAIPHAAWLTYVRELYTRIAHLEPIDRAMVQARLHMGQKEGGPYWGAPVLYTRCADGCLFNDGSVDRPELPPEVKETLAYRLNSLRIRSATQEAMSHWGDDFTQPPRTKRS